MPIKATRHYKIVRPGDVHPTAFNPGDAVPDWAAETMLSDSAAAEAGEAPSDGPAETGDAAGFVPGPETTTAAPTEGPDKRLVAKTLRKVEIDVDGKTTKFGKGVTVYDDIARRLVDSGDAEPVLTKAHARAPETT